MNAETEQFYKGIHTLALNYHWSEKDILDLTRKKREIYLKLLEESE